METKPRDARQALEDIERTARRTRRRELYKGADLIYLVWGVVWIAGFLSQHFWLESRVMLGGYAIAVPGLVWNTLVPLAILVTWLLVRWRMPVEASGDRSLFAFWWLAFAYFGLFIVFLSPVVDFGLVYASEGQRIVSGCIVLIVMFIYVSMGLFTRSRYMLWLGLGITAANVFGIFAIPAWYFLWMAVAGGGGLVATGIVTGRAWRRA